MWVGWTLVWFGLVVWMVKTTSCISWSVCVLINRACGFHYKLGSVLRTFKIQWINSGEISKTKVMQTIMALYYSGWYWMMRKDWSDYALLTRGN